MKTSTQHPYQLTSHEGDDVLLERVSLSGELLGYALQLTLTQHYRNTSERAIEAVYTFPVAAGATLAGLEAVIGGKRLAGQVMAKAEAENRYEEAIESGDLPVMVERAGRGLYTANLGGIGPGETVAIDITYVQLLDQEDGRIRLVVPTTVAQRYGDPLCEGGLQPHQTTRTDVSAEHALDLDLRVGGLMAAATIASPSHAIRREREGDIVRITLAESAWLDRDFVLVLSDLPVQPMAVRCPDTAAATTGSSMVLASFTPRWDEAAQAVRRPVDLKLLVDCSGSMAGDSIEQARRALVAITAGLGEGDRVSCSRFGSEVEHLIGTLRPATDLSMKTALSRAIRHLEADMGGTEMAQAITQVIDLPDEQKTSGTTDLILITDGEIWDVESVIRTCLRSGHRVHAIGVGHSPAESLLQAICQGTGGHCEMVTPGEDLTPAVMRVFRRVRAGQPIAVEVDWGVEPLWQSAFPRVAFSGQTLHLMALLPPQASGASGTRAQLRWCVGDQAHDEEVRVDESTTNELAKVGGAQRISQAKNDAEALQLALDYQLVTEQTNLLLVHVRAESEKTDAAPVMQRIAQMPAAGQFGVGVTLACRSAPVTSLASHASGTAFSIDGVVLASAARTDRQTLSGPDLWDEFVIPAYIRSGGNPPLMQKVQQPITAEQASALLAAFNQAAETETDVTRAFESLPGKLVPDWIESQIEDITTMVGQPAVAIAIVIQWVANFVAATINDTINEALSRQAARSVRMALASTAAADVQVAMDRIDAALEVTPPEVRSNA